VLKRSDSIYRPGRSRQWRKAKHKMVETLQVGGSHPSTPGRPRGVLLADNGDCVGVATLALPSDQRSGLVDLLGRYGRHDPTGTITIPRDCLRAVVHYTSRPPNLGHLREAFVVSIEPAPNEALSSTQSSVGQRAGGRSATVASIRG
jgi:hypothetical protein